MHLLPYLSVVSSLSHCIVCKNLARFFFFFFFCHFRYEVASSDMYYAGIRMGINAGVLDIVLSCHLLDPLVEILAPKKTYLDFLFKVGMKA